MATKDFMPTDAIALATLELARSIVNGDASSAKRALEAGADPGAFWIDGRIRLRDLVVGPKARYPFPKLKKLLSPAARQQVPSLKAEPNFWSEPFVRFLIMRGHHFGGTTLLLDGMAGASIKPIVSAKSAARRIFDKWDWIDDARTYDDRKRDCSHWKLRFKARWIGDRRVAGFEIEFIIDALGWTVVELFEAAKEHGNSERWPEFNDPLIFAQKDWEGDNVFENFDGASLTLDAMIVCLRNGGNPFYENDGALIGRSGEEPATAIFFDALREAVAPRKGWHLRIAPLIGESGIAAFREKVALEIATDEVVSNKKASRI